MLQLNHGENQVETDHPKSTYEPLLKPNGIGQLDECWDCGAGAGKPVPNLPLASIRQ